MSLAEEEPRDWKPKCSSDESSQSSHVYETPTCDVLAYQLNANLMSDDSQSHGPGHHYITPKAKGLSRQLNGNVSNVELLKIFLAPRSPDELSKGLSAMTNEKAKMTCEHTSKGGDSRKMSWTTKFLRPS